MTFCLVQSEGAKKKQECNLTNATRTFTPLKFNSSPLKNGALKTTGMSMVLSNRVITPI